MDLDLMRAKQPDYLYKKKKNNSTKAFMPLNLVLCLHILLANPKPGVALFATSLIVLHKTAVTNQRTSSPQPLLCEVEANNP